MININPIVFLTNVVYYYERHLNSNNKIKENWKQKGNLNIFSL